MECNMCKHHETCTDGMAYPDNCRDFEQAEDKESVNEIINNIELLQFKSMRLAGELAACIDLNVNYQNLMAALIDVRKSIRLIRNDIK